MKSYWGPIYGCLRGRSQENRRKSSKLPKAGPIKFFLQGTLYPDVIESISFKGPSQTIKTHHNVGGLPERMMNGQGLKLITLTGAL